MNAKHRYLVVPYGVALPFAAEVVPAPSFLLDAALLIGVLDLQCGPEPIGKEIQRAGQIR